MVVPACGPWYVAGAKAAQNYYHTQCTSLFIRLFIADSSNGEFRDTTSGPQRTASETRDDPALSAIRAHVDRVLRSRTGRSRRPPPRSVNESGIHETRSRSPDRTNVTKRYRIKHKTVSRVRVASFRAGLERDVEARPRRDVDGDSRLRVAVLLSSFAYTMNYPLSATDSVLARRNVQNVYSSVTLYRLYVTSTVPIAINVARSHTALRPGRSGPDLSSLRRGCVLAPCTLAWCGRGKKKPGGTRELTPHRRRRGGTPPRGPVQERMACIKSAELRGRVPSAASRPHGFCLFDADSALSAVPEPSLGTAFGAGAGAGALGGSAAVGATPAPVQAPSRP